ncbi:MAG TPA: ABC transporter ATP-binding protein [Candidatus Nanopelagicaceae bacterium]|nr:ABC transporter ATP-binding protein [Candidatus Nanopelagicaceae bacterium]
MAALLEINDLKTYIKQRHGQVQAVDGVSLFIEEGETLGVVGESGCGKTMTGMSVMQLLPPGGYIAGGSVKLDGKELVGLADNEMRKIRGNEVAVIFQDPMTSLNPTMNIGAQISEGVRIHRQVSRKDALDRAAEVLSLVGMPNPKERLKDFPHQLSGGLRQRVMIAMALSCEPKLLIADEPTTALDVTIQLQILELLYSLKQRLRMAVMLITHDMGVIAGRADRVNVMYAGKIVEQAPTEELFESMRHPYTAALLASIPRLTQNSSAALYSIPGLPPDLSHPPAWCRFQPRCQFATARCREEEPPLTGDTPEHQYACFNPVGKGSLRPTAPLAH